MPLMDYARWLSQEPALSGRIVSSQGVPSAEAGSDVRFTPHLGPKRDIHRRPRWARTGLLHCNMIGDTLTLMPG
jgi:hypothetical protein